MEKKSKRVVDPYTKEVEATGSNIACGAMLILAFIYFIYEIAKGRGINAGFYSIISLYNAVAFGYRALKLEKNRKLNIVTSIIWSILTIMLILDYFKVI